MVGFPFSLDQMYNCKRMEKHGFDVELDITSFTEYDLHAAIKEVLDNQSYKLKVEKASRIMQDRPQLPSEKAVMWLEHVLKHGGDHLRPHIQDMPSYQILMIDILAFIVISLIISILVIVFFLRCMYRYCIKKYKKSKVD